MNAAQHPVVVYSRDNDAAFQMVQWLEVLHLPAEFISSLKGCLQLFQQCRPTAVILDLQLPDQEIRSLLQTLPSSDRHFSLLALAPAQTEPKNLPETHQFDHIFTRPLDEEEIVPLLQDILGLDSPDSPEGETPVFNRENALHLLGEDKAILEIALTAFREDTPPIMEGLQQAVTAGDIHQARHCCHALEGSASTISADAFDHTLRSLHRTLKAGDISGVKKAFPRLQKQYSTLLAVLDGELKNLP